MNKINPEIRIEVTLTRHNGKPSGYQFRYTSDSGLVAPDGTIDLSNFGKDNVDLVFVLMAVGAMQPSFPPRPEDAVWFADWPKGAAPPPPCPDAPGLAHSSFSGFQVSNASTLKFTDKNNDNKRYTYALRCQVPGEAKPVVDDPIIINK
ncbi:MAG TPA: hypothetical protein VHF02_02510 [Luteimonas sp.]|nr:hypothetical protein [Luteimonas sp.]